MDKRSRDLVIALCLIIWTGMEVWSFVEIRVMAYSVAQELAKQEEKRESLIREKESKESFKKLRAEQDRQLKKEVEAKKERDKIKYSWDKESRDKELEKRKIEQENLEKRRLEKRRAERLKGLS